MAESTSSRVLVTGGAGYIGSHAVKRLLEQGHNVVVVDNLSRGNAGAIDRLWAWLGDDAHDRLIFHEASTSETAVMAALLNAYGIKDVLHFAAYASVPESVASPLMYYRNNVSSTVSLLEACDAAGVERFVFSSTCATYGEPDAQHIPIAETTPQSPINPYGTSKLVVEGVLKEYAESCKLEGKPFSYAALRYFNVSGDDPQGVVGEAHDPETHIIPIVLQVALGQREHITIFGDDYDTPDGTCVRDYIHVVDLVDAHIEVLKLLEPGKNRIYNLGTGNGTSVREIVEACRAVTGHPIPEKPGPRRAGDPPKLYADPSKVLAETNWRAKYTDLNETIATAWEWHKANPNGYKG